MLTFAIIMLIIGVVTMFSTLDVGRSDRLNAGSSARALGLISVVSLILAAALIAADAGVFR